jgi:hypothetical protein
MSVTTEVVIKEMLIDININAKGAIKDISTLANRILAIEFITAKKILSIEEAKAEADAADMNKEHL